MESQFIFSRLYKFISLSYFISGGDVPRGIDSVFHGRRICAYGQDVRCSYSRKLWIYSTLLHMDFWCGYL